jgi:hypothetical protein
LQPEYLFLAPNEPLPTIRATTPFRAVVLIEAAVSDAWRDATSVWLVESGCLYMMAWGHECSAWDDSVDWASIDREIRMGEAAERFVMTTWHNDESLAEVFFFAQHCARHPSVDLSRTLLLHIAPEANEARMRAAFAAAGEDAP